MVRKYHVAVLSVNHVSVFYIRSTTNTQSHAKCIYMIDRKDNHMVFRTVKVFLLVVLPYINYLDSFENKGRHHHDDGHHCHSRPCPYIGYFGAAKKQPRNCVLSPLCPKICMRDLSFFSWNLPNTSASI